MPEDANEIKAKKLAAARKKLKEFQEKEKRNENNSIMQEQQDNAPSGTTSATLSEKSDSEINLNGYGKLVSGSATPTLESRTEGITDASVVGIVELASTTTVEVAESSAPANAEAVAAAYVNTVCTSTITTNSSSPQNTEEEQEENDFTALNTGEASEKLAQSHPQTLNAIQILIAEKSQLNTDLHKYRTSCREKDLENEELRTQLTATARRLDELHKRYVEQQSLLESYRSSSEELKQQQAQIQAANAEHVAHLKELQQQLSKLQTVYQKLEQLHKDKCNELELAQIRISQLSDESCITKDTRVENLTQKQFMYEQQIRDLQAMVQQLTEDKDQASLQYQNYTKHLSAEVSNLNEKNSELSDETAQLRQREQQLLQHVGDLEREIQRNISRRDQKSDDRAEEQISSEQSNKQLELEKQIAELKEKISDLEFERHEFQLKIKSQEDRLEEFIKDLQQKQQLIEELQDHLQTLNNEQPDKARLLATMESDKIAASRAVTQNIELKKQLDELEQRFVQLTNDKADLMNKLDAEQYANREMHAAYKQMEEKLHTIDERFKFKDEEMIRLSHENMDLTRTNLMLKQQLDRLKHYEVKEYSKRYKKTDRNNIKQINSNDDQSNSKAQENEHEHARDRDEEHEHDCDQEHEHDCDREHGDDRGHGHGHDGDHDGEHKHDHAHEFVDDDEHGHNHHHGSEHEQDDSDHDHEHHDHSHNNEHFACNIVDSHNKNFHYSRENISRTESEVTTSCQEAIEDLHTEQNEHYNSSRQEQMPTLATAEAVEKLQQRFTRLMSQVADLTDEKQRLEHLVLQLQGETETIGEYITLYQTQRRVLKQREYEKAAQMKLLQAEREQMQARITMLNNLVSSLSQKTLNMIKTDTLEEQQFEHSAGGCTDPVFEQSNASDSQQQAVLPQKPNKIEPSVTESQEILTKIQSIISEIKEDTKEIPTVTTTVDHLNCCLGKFEVV